MPTTFPPDSVSAFSVFTTAIGDSTDIGALTLSATAASFDWSGIAWKNTRSGTPAANCTAGCTLVSNLHAMSAQHCGPVVNDILHFRSPDGTERTATVAARTQIGTTDLRLIRFTAAPHASLARYAVVTDLAAMIGNLFWTPQHDGTVALRRADSLSLLTLWHIDGGWGVAETSSGKPGLVPFQDGTLAMLGTAHYANGQERIDDGSDSNIDAINDILAGYSEALTTVSANSVTSAIGNRLIRTLLMPQPLIDARLIAQQLS